MGLAVGVVAGFLLARFLFHLPFEHRLAKRHTGFVVLAMTFLVYGTTELLGGYGFISVFVAPLTMRYL
jgi:sodium/hydrogen antiporter